MRLAGTIVSVGRKYGGHEVVAGHPALLQLRGNTARVELVQEVVVGHGPLHHMTGMVVLVFAAEAQRGAEVGEELFDFVFLRRRGRAVLVVNCDVITNAVDFRVRRKGDFRRFELFLLVTVR